MSIPAFGIIFIPIAFWIFLYRPRYLVPLMLVASVFVASSVVDFSYGDFVIGLQPYYFAAVLLAIRALPALLRYRRLGRRSVPAMGKIVGPLIGFWKWAVVSAFVFPVIFKGIGVINPRSLVGDVAADFALYGETAPLHWSLGNFGQVVYLTLSLIAVLYVVLGCGGDTERGERSLVALRVAIIVVSVVAAVQGVASWRGWNFPYLFFNSNPAYSQAFAAVFEGVPRVSSTFTEASSAGGFLAAGALGLLAKRLQGGRANVLVILLAVVGLILTTATTGYATFLLGGALLFFYYARGGFQRRLPQGVLRRCVIGLFLAGAVIGVVLTADPPLRDAALEMTLNKADSVSFFARTAADLYSVKLLVRTYGLGVGLGSNRPSSLGAYLLGNVGIVGTLLFGLCFGRLFVRLLLASRQQCGAPFAMLAWMLVGLLVAQGIALPDLSWPPLWAVLIAAVSLLAPPTRVRGASEQVVGEALLDGRLPAGSSVA